MVRGTRAKTDGEGVRPNLLNGDEDGKDELDGGWPHAAAFTTADMYHGGEHLDYGEMSGIRTSERKAQNRCWSFIISGMVMRVTR
jgi:hypothetical protein